MAAKSGETPMVRQFKAIKADYPDEILFFRMGDFYEMFFEDAVEAARILEITLTKRGRNEDGTDIPLCGVPYHSVDTYLAKLIQSGKKVAICEQVEDPKTAKGLVKRDVVRVVTPGLTLTDGTLEGGAPNYLAAISRSNAKPGRWGLAVVDYSTGRFAVCEIPLDRPETLYGELARLAPREVLVPDEADEAAAELQTALARHLPGVRINELNGSHFDHARAGERLKSHFGVTTLDGFGLHDRRAARCSAGALLEYVYETQKRRPDHIDTILTWEPGERMVLDDFTRRNLELVEPMRADSGRAATLLGVLDKTQTAMGARALREWILQPLLDLAEIRRRQDAIEGWLAQPALLDGARETLSGILDIERLNARCVTETAGARDLVALRHSISVLPELAEILGALPETSPLQPLGESLDALDDLHDELSAALVDEPPALLHDGGLIRDGYDEELDELLRLSRSGKTEIAKFESMERERTGIQTLKIGYNKVFGYYLEATKKYSDQVPETWIRKQTLVNAERYVTPELKEWEEKVLHASERANELEYNLFVELRARIAAQQARIKSIAAAIAEIDVLCALATVAASRNYARPEVDDGDTLEIAEGRHPVLETLSLGERFVPNDVHLDNADRQVLMVTGPNMAGKSTYMRQVALIALMAQIGSFVPASRARIGLVDRIFTRVGASDQLSQGLSTFMVEMSETAYILNHASARSLVILDEIGRGTSTFDGVSIAWSVAEYIHDRIGAKTLFATHYHELAELADACERVVNVQTAVKEWKGEILFLRTVTDGHTPHSYGIKVARLAGLPRMVLDRAQEVLDNLEVSDVHQPDKTGRPRIAASRARVKTPDGAVQMHLFGLEKDPLRTEIERLDIDSLSPRDALDLLYQLKKQTRGEESS